MVMDSEVLGVEEFAMEEGERESEEEGVQPRIPGKASRGVSRERGCPRTLGPPSSQATNLGKPPIRAQAVTKMLFLIQVGSRDCPNQGQLIDLCLLCHMEPQVL